MNAGVSQQSILELLVNVDQKYLLVNGCAVRLDDCFRNAFVETVPVDKKNYSVVSVNFEYEGVADEDHPSMSDADDIFCVLESKGLSKLYGVFPYVSDPVDRGLFVPSVRLMPEGKNQIFAFIYSQ